MRVPVSAFALLAMALSLRAADVPDPGVKLTAQSKPADAATFALAGNVLTITITSPSGIGGMTFERTAGAWPEKIIVILKYAPDRSFSMLESFSASGEKGEIGATKGVQPVLSMPKDAGKSLKLSWIDAFR